MCGYCSSNDSGVCGNFFGHMEKQEDIWSASQIIKRCCCVIKTLHIFDYDGVITVVKLSRGGLDLPSPDSEVSVWMRGRMRNKKIVILL